ncbi:MAG: O-antigen ligase family protein [Calditrichaeota bacterium]|nr:MAG: O-antigen ligase family protein [Calditrichota bacterium]
MVLSTKHYLLLILGLVATALMVVFYEYSFFVVFGFLFLIVLGIDPWINLFVLMGVMCFDKAIPGIEVGPFSLAAMHILLLLVVFYQLLVLLNEPKVSFKFFNTPVYKLLLLFFLVSILSVAVAAHKIQSIRYIRDEFFWILFGSYAIFQIDSFKKYRDVIQAWIWIGTIVTALGILQLFLNFDLYLWTGSTYHIPQDSHFFRITSTFRDPNFFANFLILPLCLGIARSLWEKETPKWNIGLMLLALILTNSRGGLLAVFIGGVILYSLRYEREKLFTRLVMLFFIVAVSAVVIFQFLPSGFKERMFLESSKADWSSIVRVLYIVATIKMILANPIFGVGIANSPLVIKNYAPPVVVTYLRLDKPEEALGGGYTHNTFLQLWAETGILGALIMIAFLMLTFYYILRVRKLYKQGRLSGHQIFVFLGMLVGFLALMIHELTITELTYHTFFTFGMVSLVHKFLFEGDLTHPTKI